MEASGALKGKSYQVTEKAVLTDRVKRLKDSFFEAELRLGTERIKFLLEAYRETGIEAPIVTRAKVFDKYLRGMTLYIDENPIVGSLTQYRRGINIYPEWCSGQPQSAQHSIFGDTRLDEQDQALLHEAYDYFTPRSQYTQCTNIFKQVTGYDHEEIMNQNFVWLDSAGMSMGFINVDYGRVVRNGLEEVIHDAQERLSKLGVFYEDSKKRDFYKASIMTCQAVIAWANRYACLAEEMAKSEPDAHRREELKRIAETCRWVPAKPARTFYEALQSFWFIHAATWIEGANPGISPGRFPQYMYPSFKKDFEEGKISEDEVVELLELLMIKCSEIGIHVSDQAAISLQCHTGQVLVLGGFTPDGRDATNRIDYLYLEAEKNVRMLQPSTVIMWHNGLSDEFLVKVIETVRIGMGKPAFINGHNAVERHLDRWKCSLEEAYDASAMGCVQTIVDHSTDSVWGTLHNFPKLLELTLNDGVNPLTEAQVGLHTGQAEDFKSFEELSEALAKQVRHFTVLGRQIACISENLTAEFLPSPFASSLVNDCLERGKDLLQGGAKYGMDADALVGAVDVGNSLAAIKKVVFEDKRITMKDLKQALKANFEGYEEVHRLLLAAPKYGNEDDYVDQIVRHWYDFFQEEELKLRSHLGRDDARPFGVVVSVHSLLGMTVGASPSGRKAYTALTDGTISAMPGTDRKGPTALIHSGAKANNSVKYCGNIFNVKFTPTMLANRAGIGKLIALIKSYMDMGGSQIQFSIVDAETLREAQKHPQQYKSLVIRVAGYSAFFVQLDDRVQEEIISRTELSM